MFSGTEAKLCDECRDKKGDIFPAAVWGGEHPAIGNMNQERADHHRHQNGRDRANGKAECKQDAADELECEYGICRPAWKAVSGKKPGSARQGEHEQFNECVGDHHGSQGEP